MTPYPSIVFLRFLEYQGDPTTLIHLYKSSMFLSSRSRLYGVICESLSLERVILFLGVFFYKWTVPYFSKKWVVLLQHYKVPLVTDAEWIITVNIEDPDLSTVSPILYPPHIPSGRNQETNIFGGVKSSKYKVGILLNFCRLGKQRLRSILYISPRYRLTINLFLGCNKNWLTN